MDLSGRSHDEILALTRKAYNEGLAKGHLAERLTEAQLKPSFYDAHSHAAAPTVYVPFDTIAGAGTAQLTATVGAGNDLILFAQIGTGVEAGLIQLSRSTRKIEVVTAGTGGTCGWAVSGLDWGVSQPASFSSVYNAMPGPGYNTSDVFACDLTSHHYKPLHNMAVKGGQIVCRMAMRPWGPVGSVVPIQQRL